MTETAIKKLASERSAELAGIAPLELLQRLLNLGLRYQPHWLR